jgi:putative ABC transport system ATP-binding protein
MKIIFEARGVSKIFRRRQARAVRALDEVSLTIGEGTFTVLTGPSGSGKTTLLALLGALERPSDGQVFFGGRDLAGCADAELARARRRMGFVFQDFSLIPALSVGDNVTFPLIPRGVPRAARLARAQKLLERFGLLDKMHERPGDLSGGEQQRVALARALAGDPDVLLADEPTSNLDPDSSREVLAILQELAGEGRTVILASHDEAAVGLASRVLTLEHGRLKQEGP